METGFGGLSETTQNEYIDRVGLQAIVDSFKGSYAKEQLEDGMQRAAAALGKYTATLSFDPGAAADIFTTVELWQNTHGELLREYVRQGAETVPEQIALSLGRERAQQYIVASFSEAVRGMKAWSGGAVVASVKSGGLMSKDAASQDARTRAVVFATIIKMDRDGELAPIFWGTSGASGMGELITAATIAVIGKVVAVIGVALIAAWVVNNQMTKRMEQQNLLTEKMCDEDPEHCADRLQEVVQKMEEARSGTGPVSDVAKTIATYAGVGLLAYIGVAYVLPAGMKALEKSRSKEA